MKKNPRFRPDRVRLIVLLYRKKGLGVEEFQEAWYVLCCVVGGRMESVGLGLGCPVSFPFSLFSCLVRNGGQSFE